MIFSCLFVLLTTIAEILQVYYALAHSAKVSNFTAHCWRLLAMLVCRDDHQADVSITHSLRIYEADRSISLLVVTGLLCGGA
jgi:hypothetical protein